MDKIDILGLKPRETFFKDSNLPKNEGKSNEPVDEKSAAEYASFIRDQSKTNIHLNLFSKKLKQNSNYQSISNFDYNKLTKDELATILARSVIKSTNHLVAINKPLGISVQGGGHNGVSIDELLEILAVKLSLKEKLHIVHRLDKDTTGVLLLARNADSAFLLKDAFKHRHIRKNYLCLTHGIPYEDHGIIDFNLKEADFDGHVVIRPDMKLVKKNIKKKTNSSESKPGEISTAFQVLCSNYNIALVQCAMVSGVKHQIRAHLAYGLETPILGDHKYSWLINENKFPILPQELSSLALTGLQISQGKVRYLPIHLHAHHLIIGEPPLPSSLFDGKADLKRNLSGNSPCRLPDLQIFAKVPNFFIKSLKSLKLNNNKVFKFALKQIL